MFSLYLLLPLRVSSSSPHPSPPLPSVGPVVYDDGALRVIYIIMLRNEGEKTTRETVGGLKKAFSLNVSALN